MHGLVNRSIQCFLQDTYGERLWAKVAGGLDLGESGFEAMLGYDDALTEQALNAATRLLDKPMEMLLEDVGTYLVSHPNTEAIRRLLRFGGETFFEFLLSLDDLPDRIRLAVPDLEIPALELFGGEDAQYELRIDGPHPGYGYVMIGVLRAMADDYGALVFLEYAIRERAGMTVRISLLDSEFAEGRSFSLAHPSGGMSTGATG